MELGIPYLFIHFISAVHLMKVSSVDTKSSLLCLVDAEIPICLVS